MKEYNRAKWWIDSNIIRTKYIHAESLKAALMQYAVDVTNNDYITISANAIKNRNPMYIDTKEGTPRQIGYVITGKTEFQRDNGTWTTQFIDLWISIDKLGKVEFEEAM